LDETHKQKGQVQTLPFGSDVLDVSSSEFLSAGERQTGQTNAQQQHGSRLRDGIGGRNCCEPGLTNYSGL
jgi:hypothetical protein